MYDFYIGKKISKSICKSCSVNIIKKDFNKCIFQSVTV